MANKSFVVQYIIKAREQFAAAADKTRRASDRMRESIDKAKLSFQAASLKIRESMMRIKKAFDESKIGEYGKKLRDTGAKMTAFLSLPVLLAAKNMKDAARDAVETRSKFATVFKDIAVESEAAANALASGYGLTGTKSRQLLGDTADLLSGFGFSQKSALDLSTQVNQLAVDLASFTNYSGGAEGASAALTKALLGERESVKSLGIAILEKDVKQEVSKMLAEGMTFETLRQAKAQATLRIALRQSKNAIGDFARTQNELANQERITSARIQDMKESFGRLLLPVALKVSLAMRSIAVWMTELSPRAKKIILIIAGIAAAIGPLLLVIGSVMMMLPALSAGFAVFGTVATAALGPIGLVAAAVAAAAWLIISNWDQVKAFFKGFSAGISATLGPTLDRLVARFREAAGIVAELFGSDGEAAKSLFEFANIGELIGSIVGGMLDTIIRGVSGMGAIIGQLMGAVASMDFSQFDIEAIKAEFLGPEAKPILANSRVDVGVNVGLDKGLQQTSPVSIANSAGRRSDVGVATQ